MVYINWNENEHKKRWFNIILLIILLQTTKWKTNDIVLGIYIYIKKNSKKQEK